ncbi:unnamed protein product [Pleuronectes platessa]|uniref:Secreted protein n=1 Tax=Pleuronectes platessa TaxID=8262 RepID=A0A9N7TNY1_PLEPL|nr:unnamed protein product [Pleuronectes platessa]
MAVGLQEFILAGLAVRLIAYTCDGDHTCSVTTCHGNNHTELRAPMIQRGHRQQQQGTVLYYFLYRGVLQRTRPLPGDLTWLTLDKFGFDQSLPLARPVRLLQIRGIREMRPGRGGPGKASFPKLQCPPSNTGLCWAIKRTHQTFPRHCFMFWLPSASSDSDPNTPHSHSHFHRYSPPPLCRGRSCRCSPLAVPLADSPPSPAVSSHRRRHALTSSTTAPLAVNYTSTYIHYERP